MLLAFMARARSASRFAMRFTFTPGRRDYLELGDHGTCGSPPDGAFDVEGLEFLNQNLPQTIQLPLHPFPVREVGLVQMVKGRKLMRCFGLQAGWGSSNSWKPSSTSYSSGISPDPSAAESSGTNSSSSSISSTKEKRSDSSGVSISCF